MRISHKHKFVFFSNPKAASESVREALDPYSDVGSEVEHPIYHHHVTPRDMRAHFEQQGWDWDDYLKFTFVRNPWDRLVSYYYYFKPDRDRRLVWITGEWNRQNALSFPDFVRSLLSTQYPALSQLDYVMDGHGDRIVDQVGRFENLGQDFQDICAKIGVTASLPFSNRGPRLAYQIYYTKQTRDIAAAVFQKESEIFGYTFEKLPVVEYVRHRLRHASRQLKKRLG